MGFNKNGKLNARSYRTLEQDLIKCFEKRGIKVNKIYVSEGATDYRITVWRK